MKHFLTTLIVVFLSVSMNAQNAEKATLLDKGIIELPANTDLNNYYTFDISSLKFTEFQEAAEFFESKAGKLYRFRPVSVDANKALIYIEVNQKPGWTAGDWNAYLKSKMIQNPVKRTTK